MIPFEFYLRSVRQVFDFVSDKTGEAEPLANGNFFDVAEIISATEHTWNDEMIAFVCGQLAERARACRPRASFPNPEQTLIRA